MTPGTVREFDAEAGIGVVDSAVTPGGCFVHYSAIAAIGHRALAAGQQVRFAWEPADQDGYAFRATRVVVGGGDDDGGADDPPLPPDTGPTSAYRSTLTITTDRPTVRPTDRPTDPPVDP